MEICVQSGGLIEHVGAKKGYALIKEAGFTGIDWNGLDNTLPPTDIRGFDYVGKSVLEKSLDEVIAYFADEIAEIRKNGLTVSQAHAPFPAYVSGHPEIQEFMINIYRRCIEMCEYVGCKNLVIHSTSYTLQDNVNTHEIVRQLNMDLYEALIPTLVKTNVTVCLENLFFFDEVANEGACSNPYEAVQYIDALNAKAGKECFGLCLDTGHLALLHKDFRTYVPILGKRIKALHIHDNDGVRDLHVAPLTGKVKWNNFLESLKKIGYDGDLSFETFMQTRRALEVDEELVLPWLQLIYRMGECFRKHITQ